MEAQPKKIITPAEASAELLLRRKARVGLAEYIEYTSGMKPPRHIRYLCAKLQDAMNRKVKRLLVCFPPGHAKSFCISWHFPGFYLGTFPDHNIIAVTHTESFSETWGRRVRNLMLGDEHKLIFPGAQIAEDSRAAGRWDTTENGTYYATGVGGSVTGKRSNLIILDDLIRGQEDANSQLVRDNMWDWYGADLYSRQKAEGIIVFITTRWHLDDLAGRLIAAEKNGGDKWEKVIFPAFALENDPLGRKVGAPLWPDVIDKAMLENIRKQPAMTSRLWSALYQQNPVEAEGNVLKRSWFKPWRYKEPPKCNYILQTWDTAGSTSKNAAYSAGITLGVFDDPDSGGLPAVILLAATRARLLYPDLRKLVQRCAHNYLDDHPTIPRQSPPAKKPDMILVERKHSGEQLIPDLMRAGIPVTGVNPGLYGSKDSRINLASPLIENGRFYIPTQPPNFTVPRRFADDFVTEVCSYPAAASRDYVDALSQGLIRIAQTGRVRSTDDPRAPEYTKIGAQHRSYY